MPEPVATSEEDCIRSCLQLYAHCVLHVQPIYTSMVLCKPKLLQTYCIWRQPTLQFLCFRASEHLLLNKALWPFGLAACTAHQHGEGQLGD